ncbi:MAG: ribonucleoside-diphosphate reductase subunit alpha, partial [Pseudomonadota bacterium]
LGGIVGTWNENVWLASKGGGIGTYWGNVRGIGEPVGLNGKTSGIIPFVRVMDSLTLAISQGSLRRGSAACYLDISHPEIEEFLEIRKPSGDFNRKALNLHHGVLVTDEFMEAVRNGDKFDLKSPKTGEVRGEVDARSLFQKLVETRLATGEPYIVFNDTVNRMMPKHHRDLGLKVSTSNLCSEITLPTGIDHLGNDRTAVCCLSSLNLEKWDEWNGDKMFIEDVMRFLDNVLQDYIDRAPPEMERARYSAERERSVGLGVMGFHSFLQQKGLGFESAMAKAHNLKMFQHIQAKASEASMLLAQERGPCPDAAEMGAMERFSCKMAIAPTASISIICGGTSACIEPIPANIYTHKTLSGSFIVKNPYLEKILDKKSKNSNNVWNSILENGGSVQHLDFLSEEEKASFKTSFEIDQRWLLEFAADRAPYIDQAQSLNLFIPADVDKWDLMMLHFQAWEKGIKSLYYLRSKSVQRAGFAGGVEADNTDEKLKIELSASAGEQTDYEECLSCQ